MLKTMTTLESAALRMKQILGLKTEPVGVFLLKPDADMRPFKEWTPVARHRYCQALMKARNGQSLLLEPEELACPAAARAFGFRPLPEGLASGNGLVGFGIVPEPATGRRMFESMPRLTPGEIARLALCPLRSAPALPDVIVVEGSPESLMWLALADLNVAGGDRRRADTAVLQATCVDATVIPFKERRLNFSLGCYGCREATDLGPGECVLGFPGDMLERLNNGLEYLVEKAIPRSRGKAVFKALESKSNEKGCSS